MNTEHTFYPKQEVVGRNTGDHYVVIGFDDDPEFSGSPVVGRALDGPGKGGLVRLTPSLIYPDVPKLAPVGVGMEQFELANSLARGIKKMRGKVKYAVLCSRNYERSCNYAAIDGYDDGDVENFSKDAVDRANIAAKSIISEELASRLAQIRTIIPDFVEKD